MDTNTSESVDVPSQADESPSVKLAILGVWVGIALSAVVALIDKLVGDIGDGSFVGLLLAYGAFCIVPYKLQQRSNAARYWLLVLSVIGVLFELAGIGHTPRLDLIVGWIWTPVSVAILIVLFSAQGTAFFLSKRSRP